MLGRRALFGADVVRLDLNSADAAFQGQVRRIDAALTTAALDEGLARALVGRKQSDVQRIMDRLYQTAGVDFVSLLDGEGVAVYRPAHPVSKSDDLSVSPLVKRALESGRSASGTLLLTREELTFESPELAARARFQLLETPEAHPTNEQQRDMGMVLAVATPISDSNGNTIGVLYGGELLNRRYELVDQIKREVFSGEHLEGEDVGTVTVFQGDLRIATNVLNTDGTRAVGTRMSAAEHTPTGLRGRRPRGTPSAPRRRDPAADPAGRATAAAARSRAGP